MSFSDLIRNRREEIGLPLRKVAAHLDIDTSTLSKVERGERYALPAYLKPLSIILQMDLKELEKHYIADKINKDLGGLKHLREGLKEAEKQLKRSKT